MSERVSDERLKEITRHHLPFNTEVESMALELLALRASHRALYEALEWQCTCPDHVWEGSEPSDSTCELSEELHAALATAKQLQGAAEQKEQG